MSLDVVDNSNREIPLSQGKVAIVDAADYDRVSQYRWYAVQCKGTWYARRHVLDPNSKKKKKQYLHRFIMNAQGRVEVHHKDDDGLNNRKSNLKILTKLEHSATKRPHNDGSSKLKGVHTAKHFKGFRATIKVNGRHKGIGTFNTEKEAGLAFDYWARKLCGPDVYLNFPNEYWKPPSKRPNNNTSSRFIGVSFNSRLGKWQAEISKDKVHYNLGLHEDEESAARARDKFAIELNGKKAKLNFPE